MNQQWVVSMFNQVEQQQQKQKSVVRSMLLKEYAHFLPEELWGIIVNYMFQKEKCVVHIIFEKLYFFQQDYYYLFSGTKKQLTNSMNFLKNDISHNVDLPIDTYCNFRCLITKQQCPDENGTKCGCTWIHSIFPTETTFKHRVDNIMPSHPAIIIRDISHL